MNDALVRKVRSTGKVKIGPQWVPAEQMTDGTVLWVASDGSAVEVTEKQAATYFKTGDAFGRRVEPDARPLETGDPVLVADVNTDGTLTYDRYRAVVETVDSDSVTLTDGKVVPARQVAREHKG